MLSKYVPIVSVALDLGVTNENQLKYILATAQHETNNTFDPVREAYWVRNKFIKKFGKIKGAKRFENWGKKRFKTTRSEISYYPYYGRGYVQLTWKHNYVKFNEILHKFEVTEADIVANPDMVLNTKVAAFILVYGMVHGSFTGRKLDHYINDSKTDFIGARRIINGRDKAKHIAMLAEKITID